MLCNCKSVSILVKHCLEISYIILSQEVKRTEGHVVLQIEAPGCLQSHHVVRVVWRSWYLLRTSLCLVLAMCVLRRCSRASSVTAMMSMGHMRLMRHARLHVRSIVMACHDCDGSVMIVSRQVASEFMSRNSLSMM